MARRSSFLRWLCVSLTVVSLVVLVAPTPSAGAAVSITYTYEVRGRGNTTGLEEFAARAAQTYADGRGWGLGGSIRFLRIASGGDFTLWLSAAQYLPGFSSGCSAQWSCRVGRNVIINESRFAGASPAWLAAGGSLRDYQHLVVNHETGHWLGFPHAFCSGPGLPAPVMQQQSKGLQSCLANPWPTAAERIALAQRKGVPIIPPRIPAGVVTPVAAAGRAGIPATAEAIGVNLTITEPEGNGFATAFPCGSALPGTSNLNFAAGATVAAFTLVKPGAGGAICVRSTVPAHLVVDVSGYVPAGSGYQPRGPRRILDTRMIGGRVHGTAAVKLPTDSAGAALTITATQPTAAGFVTVYPCGSPRPVASVLNFAAGGTVANSTLAAAGTGGRVCLYSRVPTHLVVDLVGSYPSGSGFAIHAPHRLVDTRRQPIHAGLTLTKLPAGGLHALNLTVTGASASGWARAFPCTDPQPETSNINFEPGQTVANAVLAAGESRGLLCVVSTAPVHVIIDDAGRIGQADYVSVTGARLLDSRRS